MNNIIIRNSTITVSLVVRHNRVQRKSNTFFRKYLTHTADTKNKPYFSIRRDDTTMVFPGAKAETRKSK